jgi:hypothetical protein
MLDSLLPASIEPLKVGWLFDLSSPGWPQWPVFYTGGTVAQLRREGALVLPVHVPPHDSPLFIRVALSAPTSVVGTSMPVFPS